MFNKKIDILAIGDITTDAFIRLKDASVHCKINTEDCELCMRFGDKIPFEFVKVIRAVGNAPNAAVCSARLGLHSALVSNIGKDQNGRECRVELQRNKVDISYIKTHLGKPTNYHFVLWYDKDRTILVNHTAYNYKLPHFPEPRWIYLSSLADHTLPYHMEIADYLEKHPRVKLAFQPGTFQISLGLNDLKRIYARTDVIVVNVEEAQRILGSLSRDIKKLLGGLAEQGPKLVIITDNTRGAYLFDGDHYYHIPMYPDPRPAYERTGCGDALASTFVSALALGKSPLEAFLWSPINPMSVAQFIGAQEGLLNREQLEWWLKQAPADFKPKEI
ncbi:MAG: hypothetical protein A3B11_02035 [Candidatus Taylorbacteria bacterium RIFCSPLOWO2_01_FULL_44_26]|uniref:Carbohydrate kinase PfkB domain-containing protein n=2 Tax=Candidatus Tayloriibacteriota TaxID=1817919 RepID=A0A1G2MJ04_9BACT|nr:MAG: hypothetical protein A3D50_00225 [Candidatus Taylorbacteria bacterium RIFCSPHIGHO2_02_FULL_44_12]OHA30749.1 MAG: hypothetical protein A3B11_02035 [Candidatus Taylorbacteria bacterium RIFCSPLOWO2_01_FULL_44_26]